MPKAVYRNREIFIFSLLRALINYYVRPIGVSLHITSEHQNIDEIAISRPDLKTLNFEKLLFYSTNLKI